MVLDLVSMEDGSLLHFTGLDTVPDLPRHVSACVLRMDNQPLTGRFWLLVAPKDNLRQDFSSVVGGVKTSPTPFGKSLTT
jgi:hypothetical protein